MYTIRFSQNLESEMERAFQIDDVRRLILGVVPSDGDLARCAIVCRAFMEPALDVLWRDLDSWKYVWQLLAPRDLAYEPDDLWNPDLEHVEDVYFSTIISAKMYTVSARWERFLWYSRRIHSIKGWPNPTSHRRLVEIATQTNGGQLPLPALEQTVWHVPSPAMGAFEPLSSLSLRAISLRAPPCASEELKERNTAIALSELHANVPCLEHVDIDYFSVVSSARAHQLIRFDHLTTVTTKMITSQDAFHILIAMSGLKQLSFWRIDLPDFRVPSAPIISHALRAFRFAMSAFTFVQLFQNVRFDSLEHIEWLLYESGSLLRATFETLVAAISIPAFRSLRLRFPRCAEKSHVPPRAFLEAFCPLLACRALRSIVFENGGLFTFTASDDEFVKFPQAWPELESFVMKSPFILNPGHDAPPHPPPYPSTVVLHHLRRYCPKLETLVCPLLTLGERGLPLLPGSAPTHPLKVFHFYGIPRPELGPGISDEEARAWAAELLRLFPRARPPRPRPFEHGAEGCLGSVLSAFRSISAV